MANLCVNQPECTLLQPHPLPQHHHPLDELRSTPHPKNLRAQENLRGLQDNPLQVEVRKEKREKMEN